MTKSQTCLVLCISRHIARLEGKNEATAITRTARKLRSETKDAALYELLKAYSSDMPAKTVGGVRLTGDAMKVASVAKLESEMRQYGVLPSHPTTSNKEA